MGKKKKQGRVIGRRSSGFSPDLSLSECISNSRVELVGAVTHSMVEHDLSLDEAIATCGSRLEAHLVAGHGIDADVAVGLVGELIDEVRPVIEVSVGHIGVRLGGHTGSSKLDVGVSFSAVTPDRLARFFDGFDEAVAQGQAGHFGSGDAFSAFLDENVDELEVIYDDEQIS